jgi:hypothetical protein
MGSQKNLFWGSPGGGGGELDTSSAKEASVKDSEAGDLRTASQPQGIHSGGSDLGQNTSAELEPVTRLGSYGLISP